MIAGLGWMDLAMLAALALSVVVGLVRGLVFEVLSLAGWVVAYFAAPWFAVDLVPYLPVGEPGSALRHGVALLVVFIVVLLIWSLLARLVRSLLHATPLSVIDRVGGGAFGLLRGAVLLLVLATLVQVSPAAQSGVWQQSVGGAWLQQALRTLRPLLPSEMGRWLPEPPPGVRI